NSRSASGSISQRSRAIGTSPETPSRDHCCHAKVSNASMMRATRSCVASALLEAGSDIREPRLSQKIADEFRELLQRVLGNGPARGGEHFVVRGLEGAQVREVPL